VIVVTARRLVAAAELLVETSRGCVCLEHCQLYRSLAGLSRDPAHRLGSDPTILALGRDAECSQKQVVRFGPCGVERCA
jgi:hypothetical protein